MKLYVKVDDPPEYFPADTESLNAEFVDGGKYRLKNSSVFTPDLAYGDIVSADEDEKGLLWIRSVDRHGAYSSIRVVCLSCDADRFIEALEGTTKLGAGYSLHDQYGVAIVTVPPDVSYSAVFDLLQQLPRDDVELTQLATRHSIRGR